MAMILRGSTERDDNGIPTGKNYLYLTSATGATLVKATPGFLGYVTFNKPVATSVVTLYDCSTTATLTGTIAVITIPSSPQPVSMFYDVATLNGLVVSVATLGSDMTITFI